MPHFDLFSLLPLQFNEINIKKTALGEEEISGIAKQIDYIERINVDECKFEGSSFYTLCQEIQNRSREVSQPAKYFLLQQVAYCKWFAFAWRKIVFML